MSFRSSALFVSLIAGCLLAHASVKKPIHPPHLPVTTPQGMEGGFWRTDGDFDPILHLKNILLKTQLDVTPSIIFADGTEFRLPLVHLDPAGVASVDIRIALKSLPSALQPHLSQFGMTAISYQWSWPAVIACIQDTDEIASLSNVSSTLATISEVHKLPEEATTHLLRGTWWKPTPSSDYVLALGNTSLSAKQVQLQISDHLGNSPVRQTIHLPSHQSTLLHLSNLIAGSGISGGAGNIVVSYSGPRFGVVASASIEDPTIGYSVTPHLVDEIADDTPAQPVTLDAPGLMVGKPDPAMLFPTGTSFMPYAVLHNISTNSVRATLSLTSESAGGHPTTQSLDTFSLAPDQSVQVDMSRYFGAHNPLPDGYAQLSLSFNGHYRDVIFDTGSADQSGTYVFQVMPSGEAPTANKIISYWTAEGDSSTMISLWNFGAKAQDATLILYYSGGQYRIPVHLEARQSYNLDIMTLLKSRVPDPDGNLIPAFIASGSAVLVGPGGELDKMTIVLSASGYNVRNATCFPMCINCGGVVDVTVNGVSLGITQTAQASAEVDMADGSQLEYGGDWTITNSAIASIDGSGAVTGYVAGNAIITFTVLNAPPGTLMCYQSAEDNVCEDEDWSGAGGVSVYDLTPVIDSITSDTWNAGVPNTNVTISGQHFGTNLPTINLSDPSIGIQITNYSDSSITATFTPGANTPTENVNVSVTNNGYGSNAFNGNGSGDSPTSGQQTATVDAMQAVTPNIKFNGSDIVGTTQNVVAGQQIVLTEDVPSPQNGQIQSRSWNVTSGTAIGGYSPATAGASITTLTPNANASSYTLYWLYPGNPLTVSYTYTLTNGRTSQPVTATFNVTGPSVASMTTPTGTVQIFGSVIGFGPTGIQFNPTISWGGSGQFKWAQFITNESATLTLNSGTVQNCVNVTVPSPPPAGTQAGTGLDDVYPFDIGVTTHDNPALPLSQTSYKTETRSFNAQMYFLWDPALPSGCTSGINCTSIPVPLGSVTWGWSGTASFNGTAWQVTASNVVAPAWSPGGSEPTWGDYVTGSLSCH